MSETKGDMKYCLCALQLCLISTTITAITNRYMIKIVHIIWTTVSHFDVCWPITAVTTMMKTHLPADLTVCYCRVSTIQPGGQISAASLIRWTWSWHSCAGWPLKTEPSRSDSSVTITVVIRVCNLSVSIIKTCVILTCWYIKNNNNNNLTFRKLKIIVMNILIFLVVISINVAKSFINCA